ncbi:hypothetical protein ACFQWB_13995 [Paenibacillus thermoaerophilus]|uniref:YgiT-type zinc finger domain-containing protein n=1 Tax=Paenibacillus thermoaerophilus TaxID=1215385 RepID=A0ABW2V9R0_9BACL|nr:hypothetical protein [Paenibacillus thermoaerophilus]TMV15938.1 hypothetical protein FE781_10155 [Paenibacillus thermoaerophilus]
MSFCCGASMIGTKGTLRHIQTHIHNVPLLFCPVCQRVEVHYRIEPEYEILAEYAHGDGAYEVDFLDYVDYADSDELFENCTNHEQEDPLEIVKTQIDSALDLLMLAKQWGDFEWEQQLKRRLAVMSERKAKLKRQRAAQHRA